MNEPALEFDPQLATDATGMTVNNFHKASKTDPPTLILRPAFQRNLVWNRQQQSFLIDSILRGLPVPELYLQIATSADGSERLTVVDGQQRISACIGFVDGALRLDDSDDLDSRWRSRTFAEIGDELKARFLSFKFVVRDLPSRADEGVLREIFRRLNRTVEALEPQELRHAAYTGAFLQLVERGGAAAALEDLGVFTPKDYLRRRNDEFVAEVLLAIDASAFPNKKEGLDQLFLTYERRGVPEARGAELARRFGRALAFVESASSQLRKSRFRNKSDCYSLLTFLARNAESIPAEDPALSEMVTELLAFSSLINAMKREEAQGRSVDPLAQGARGKEALAYLRAVERAASDRLSRVRRDAALAALLGDKLEPGASRPLNENDGSWKIAGADLEDQAADEFDEAQERQSLQEALLEDEPLS